MKRRTLLIVITLVGIVIAGRLLPHLPNFTPVTAVALAAGVYLKRYWALIIPFIGLLLSDIFIGFYDFKLMLGVYGSFALIGLIGWWLKNHKGVFNTLFVTIGSAVLFFVITNTLVWAFSPWYTKDLTGFLLCFELAIPFFRSMLIGDLVYVPILFAVFEYAPSIKFLLTTSPRPAGRINSLCFRRHGSV